MLFIAGILNSQVVISLNISATDINYGHAAFGAACAGDWPRRVVVDIWAFSRRASSSGAGIVPKHRQAERVVAVELPKHRSCMHLDTVMTHIDIDTFSVYPSPRSPGRSVLDADQGWTRRLKRTQESTLVHALSETALGIDQVRLITTGGDI